MIVMTQHRSRGYLTSIVYNINRLSFSDATLDWNEWNLLYYLGHWSRREGEPPQRPLRPDPVAPVFGSRVSGVNTVAQNTTTRYHVEEDDGKQHVVVTEEDDVEEQVVDDVGGQDVEQHVRGEGVEAVEQQLSGGGGVWWWDTSLPLGLASIAECQQMHHLGQNSHPLFFDRVLKCYDSHHAGYATLRDMVTMLLNLLCNSVLQEVPKTACCHS